MSKNLLQVEWQKMFQNFAPITLHIPKSSWARFPSANQLHPDWLNTTNPTWIFDFEKHWFTTQAEKVATITNTNFNWHHMQTRRATQMKTVISNFFDELAVSRTNWFDYNPLGQMGDFTKEDPTCRTIIMYIYAANVWIELFVVFLKKEQILKSNNCGQNDECFTQLDKKIEKLGGQICQIGLNLGTDIVANSGELQLSNLIRLSNVCGYLLNLLLTH